MPFLLLPVATACLASGLAYAAEELPPTGNARGLALLARVHRAYERVPAVITTVRVGSTRVRFTLLLRGGLAVGEEYVGVSPTGTTILVASGTGPTYARDPGAACWRRVATTDPQSLEDLGVRFPDAYRTIVGSPTRAAREWLLPVRTAGRDGDEVSGTMHVDPKTMLLRSDTLRVHGRTLTEHVQALRHALRLPSPVPAC